MILYITVQTPYDSLLNLHLLGRIWDFQKNQMHKISKQTVVYVTEMIPWSVEQGCVEMKKREEISSSLKCEVLYRYIN